MSDSPQSKKRPGETPRIDHVFAYLAADVQGDEGIVGISTGDGSWLPLVFGSRLAASKAAVVARAIASRTSETVRLARFSTREDMETYRP